MAKRVLIVQRCVPDYRIVFHNEVCRRLEARGIDAKVLCGVACRSKGFEEGSQGIAKCERVSVWRLGDHTHWLKGSVIEAYRSEYTILDEGIAPLHNHVVLVLRRMGLVKHVAFWGHGWDFLYGEKLDWRGRLRRMERKKADWWFAYSSASAVKLREQGVAGDRITIVNNASDVRGLREALVVVSTAARDEAMRRLFPDVAPEGRTIGVFCSRFCDYKDVGFALRVAERVHRSIPEFRLIVIGSGNQELLVRDFSRSRSWCAYIGPVHGTARAVYLKGADVWLTSGAVGLEVVDALAAGLPIVIRRGCGHGPEMSYVRPGENALVLEGDVEMYASHVVDLLRDRQRMMIISERARATGDGLGSEIMAESFAAGVAAWINTSEKGGG